MGAAEQGDGTVTASSGIKWGALKTVKALAQSVEHFENLVVTTFASVSQRIRHERKRVDNRIDDLWRKLNDIESKLIDARESIKGHARWHDEQQTRSVRGSSLDDKLRRMLGSIDKVEDRCSEIERRLELWERLDQVSEHEVLVGGSEHGKPTSGMQQATQIATEITRDKLVADLEAEVARLKLELATENGAHEATLHALQRVTDALGIAARTR